MFGIIGGECVLRRPRVLGHQAGNTFVTVDWSAQKNPSGHFFSARLPNQPQITDRNYKLSAGSATSTPNSQLDSLFGLWGLGAEE